MLGLFKWIWQKAQAHGEQRILDRLYGLRSYHHQQAELAYFKDRYEPDTKDDKDDFRKFMRPKLSPKEHSAVAGELSRLLTDIERQREQEVDNG